MFKRVTSVRQELSFRIKQIMPHLWDTCIGNCPYGHVCKLGWRMFHKILWKSHPPQGICCSERMLKHFLSHQISGQFQETLIPQETIWECLGPQQRQKSSLWNSEKESWMILFLVNHYKIILLLGWYVSCPKWYRHSQVLTVQ